MKVNIYFTSILLFLVSFAFAQAPDTMWTRTYGGADYDIGESVQQTSDGGYIVTGITYSFGAGLDDVYLIKTDSLGDTVWTRTYGSANYEGGISVQQTSDGGYIIAGATGPGYWAMDFYVIKPDSLGNTMWSRTYGGIYQDQAYSIQQTSDGNYIIVGFTYSFGSGVPIKSNVYLIKTNSLGDTLWTRVYGGEDWEDGYSVQQTSDGGYIITGATLSYGAGGADVYLIKIDSLGDTLWTKTYGGTQDDWGEEVQETSDHGYIIVGTTRSFGLDHQVYLIKTDSLGDTLWIKVIGGDSIETGQSIQQTSDGGYVIAGATNSVGAGGRDVWLIRIDLTGNILWTQTYGGTNSDFGYSVQQTSDGGYIIAGFTDSFGAGSHDVYLIKTKPDSFGVEEQKVIPIKETNFGATIFSGSLILPKDRKCKVYDITGRLVAPDNIRPGIYFIEVDGQITKKVIKVR